MDFTIIFIKLFSVSILLVLPLLLFFIFLICILGLSIGRCEQWSRFEAIYYAFITATTVGYGDYRPLCKLSRFLAIIIAFAGLVFSGIIVSLVVHNASYAFEATHDLEKNRQIVEEKI